MKFFSTVARGLFTFPGLIVIVIALIIALGAWNDYKKSRMIQTPDTCAPPPAFIQISAGPSYLSALDSEGHVWVMMNHKCWTRL